MTRRETRNISVSKNRKKLGKARTKFRSEDEEREFWANADSADHVDWSDARRVVLPNLKPSQKTISLRLPAMMLAERIAKERRGERE